MKRAIVVGMMVLLASGFALASGDQEGSGDSFEITMWFGRENFKPSDNFATFHEENPNIKVTADVIPLEQVMASYPRAFASQTAPDFFQQTHYFVGGFADKGMVMDIGPIMDAWEEHDPEDFNDVHRLAWDTASYQGKVYGMSLHVSGQSYWYRSDVLGEAGLEPANTWEDVLAIGRKVTGPDMWGVVIPAENREWAKDIFYAAGGVDMDGVVQLDSPAGLRLVTFFQTMVNDGVAPRDQIAWTVGDVRASIWGGRAAQALVSENIFPAIVEQGLEYKKHWEVGRIPHREGAEADFKFARFGFPYFVSAQSKGKEEAILRVLQYVSRKDISIDVALRYQPVSRDSVFNDPQFKEQLPWWEVIVPISVAHGYPVPPHRNAAELNDVLDDFDAEVFADTNADPQQIVSKYQERLDALR